MILLKKRGNANIVIPDSNFVQAVLEQLGEKSHRILRLRPHQWVHAGRLMAPPVIRDGDESPVVHELNTTCYPSVVNDMFHRVFLPDGALPQMDTIVVLLHPHRGSLPRNCTISSCVSNVGEILMNLKKKFGRKYKVVRVSPDERSLEKLTNVFARAKIVIGLHGRGFGAVTMMQRGGHLIDINYMYPRSFYRAYAQRFGVDTHNIVHTSGNPRALGLHASISLLLGAVNRKL